MLISIFITTKQKKIKEVEEKKTGRRFIKNGVERVRRPYKLIFESCGKKTKVCVWYKGIIHPTGVIDVEFKKIKEILGECEYRQGIGLIKKMSQDELFDFLEKHDLNDVLMPIESMLMRYHRYRGEFYKD
jgi:hypothetical protein